MSENISLIIQETNKDETVNAIDHEIASMFDLGKKKKKHKEKDKKKEIRAETPPTYTYSELLNNIYTQLGTIETNTTNKFMICQPIVQKLSIKKVVWCNFNDTCIALNRTPDHLFQFVLSELSTQGSINENKQMIIKGKYFAKNIEVILRKYMCSYVQCNMCHSYKTTINRNIINRLNILVCSNCKSSRSIKSIKKMIISN